MHHKITIQQERPRKEETSYMSFDDLYEQVVEDIDINALVIAINTHKKS